MASDILEQESERHTQAVAHVEAFRQDIAEQFRRLTQEDVDGHHNERIEPVNRRGWRRIFWRASQLFVPHDAEKVRRELGYEE